MKINIKTLLIAAAFMFTSCDEFLEKPDTTGTVDQEAVYSSKKNAFSALMMCYNNVLRLGWPGGMGIGHSTLGAISGEVKKPHSIDTTKCIKCGVCMDTCKFGAISKK